MREGVNPSPTNYTKPPGRTHRSAPTNRWYNAARMAPTIQPPPDPALVAATVKTKLPFHVELAKMAPLAGDAAVEDVGQLHARDVSGGKDPRHRLADRAESQEPDANGLGRANPAQVRVDV